MDHGSSGDAQAAAITLQLRRAADIAGLKQAALQTDALVTQLHAGGSRVEQIARCVCSLNRELFARLWSLLAPPEHVANSCLVVMGSEGRGEQILKTDQDNALLWRDGASLHGVPALADRFTAALIDLGYPRCPGNIMLSNPLWCQPVESFKQSLRGWMFGGEPDGVMHLAIFLDAAAVAGDASLLRQARGFVDDHLVDNDVFFARFASAADQFEAPGGWWSRLTHLRSHDEAGIDLKKLGTFPVVHGVRALALQHHVDACGTAERLQVLAERGHLPVSMAAELTDALHGLMGLKLTHQLSQRERGVPIDNRVQVSTLSAHDHDRLDDALVCVRRFRLHLRQLYRLDSL